MTERRLGIDLGTSTVRIAEEGKGIVLEEASVIALDAKSGKVIACGNEALPMLGRAPASIRVVRPLEKGVIADYDCAEQMIHALVGKVCTYRVMKPRAAVSVPACVTEVEQRSIVQAMTTVGVRRVALIEEYVAAAIGAGMDVTQPHGCMAVDIGAGTTDAVILSLRGVTAAVSERVGGDDLDDAIVRMARSALGHVIGKQTAEAVKKEIGSVLPSRRRMQVRGRDAQLGLPCIKTITAKQVREAIAESVEQIVGVIQRVLETAPPETVADVLTDGIVLTGGTARLNGLAEYISACTGVRCRVADNPEQCVALGVLGAMNCMKANTGGVYDINQFAYERDNW